MSTDKNKQDWSEDQELTAYALGELEGAELAAFEARIAGDEEALALVAELQALGANLEQELAGEVQLGLSVQQREAIEERMRPSAGARARAGKPGIGRVGWVALAAGFAGLCFGGYEFFGPGLSERMGGGDSSQVALETARRDSAQRLGNFERSSTVPSEPLQALSSLGYADGDGGLVHNPVLPGAIYLGRNEDLSVVDLNGYGQGPGKRLRYLGYLGDPGEAEATNRLDRLGYGAGGDDDEDEDEAGARVQEPANREAYERIYENPFQRVADEPRSTFSIDVDTASYANMRRFLESGSLPPADAVRIEELINYFPYAYPEPTGEHPFSVHTEVGSAPWAPAHRLVRIGLQAKHTLPAERRGSNLVFLLDVSGSMNSANKLPLLKQALHMLVQQLDERDTISIVVYAGSSGLVLPPTRCDLGVNIHMALEQLQAGGSTNGGAGIELAYQVASQNFIDGGINRVILGTDGDLNMGITSNGDLTRLIEKKAKTGVFLSVLGFGSGNLQDSKMEQLADKGNGNYAYIDSLSEARKVLVVELGSTLETVAKDVKLQVEFNPARVQAYRLLGYENRMLATRDFNDDKKDAGEVGAGHSVTALYEVVPVGVELQQPSSDPLRYQRPASSTDHAFSAELLNLALRYKQPDSDTSTLLNTHVADSTANFHELSNDTRWAASIAAFGMLLRDSEHKGTANMSEVIQWAAESLGPDAGGYRAQFIGLAGKARQLMQK